MLSSRVMGGGSWPESGSNALRFCFLALLVMEIGTGLGKPGGR